MLTLCFPEESLFTRALCEIAFPFGRRPKGCLALLEMTRDVLDNIYIIAIIY